MQRTLQTELLDSLEPDHPDALRSRRDLRLINRCMGNDRWLARTLGSLLRPGETALELGAGDGAFGLRLAGCGIAVDGLDLCPRPAAWPSTRAWHCEDLRRFRNYERYPLVAGNLIFHHFSAAELAVLGEGLRRSTRTIVACEPVRRRSSQIIMGVLGPLLGASAVTLHDARVSVAAGFLADELPCALGLRPDAWNFRCISTALGAYRMVATRRG